MTAPFSALAATNATRLGLTEQQILQGLATRSASAEFFDLTNLGCFEGVRVRRGEPIGGLPSQIDAVLEKYGIPFGSWEKTQLPPKISDRRIDRFRWSNGVVHVDLAQATG